MSLFRFGYYNITVVMFCAFFYDKFGFWGGVVGFFSSAILLSISYFFSKKEMAPHIVKATISLSNKEKNDAEQLFKFIVNSEEAGLNPEVSISDFRLITYNVSPNRKLTEHLYTECDDVVSVGDYNYDIVDVRCLGNLMNKLNTNLFQLPFSHGSGGHCHG